MSRPTAASTLVLSLAAILSGSLAPRAAAQCSNYSHIPTPDPVPIYMLIDTGRSLGSAEMDVRHRREQCGGTHTLHLGTGTPVCGSSESNCEVWPTGCGADIPDDSVTLLPCVEIGGKVRVTLAAHYWTERSTAEYSHLFVGLSDGMAALPPNGPSWTQVRVNPIVTGCHHYSFDLEPEEAQYDLQVTLGEPEEAFTIPARDNLLGGETENLVLWTWFDGYTFAAAVGRPDEPEPLPQVSCQIQ